MTEADNQNDLELIACEICMKEIPKSAATVPEATDYVAHFCGLDCYKEWKKQNDKTPRQPE